MPKHIATLDEFNALLDDIGPIPRYLFSNQEEFVKEYQQSRLLTARQLQSSSTPISSLSNYATDLNPKLQYFIAPFVLRQGVIDSRIGLSYGETIDATLTTLDEKDYHLHNYEYRFLSETCDKLLSKVNGVKDIEDLKSLEGPKSALDAFTSMELQHVLQVLTANSYYFVATNNKYFFLLCSQKYDRN